MAYKHNNKVCAGNLSEIVLAYELTPNVQFSDCNQNQEILDEIEQNTDRVRDIRNQCKTVVSQLPQATNVIIGGSNSKEKADLICRGTDNKTFRISLKRYNNAPERKQGQSWQNVSETYEQLGFEVSEHQSAYLRAAKEFTRGQLRYTSKKADWTPELHRAADIAQGFFAAIEADLAQEGANSDQLVRGLYSVILGDNTSLYHVELGTGTVHYIQRKPVSLNDLRYEPYVSDTGRTTRLRVYSGDTLVCYTENSVKAQRATHKQAAAGGYKASPDVRSICPQTKICLTEEGLSLLS